MKYQINRVRNWKQFLNEMKSYQETNGKLKEFAEGLRTHLETNGYIIMDNPSLDFDKTLEDKRNIIFTYDDKILFVHYGNNNKEAYLTIANYFNSISLGIKGGRGIESRYTSIIKFSE